MYMAIRREEVILSWSNGCVDGIRREEVILS